MDDVSAHAGQHWFQLLEQGLFRAHHERQRAGLRAAGAAGDGGVGNRVALLVCLDGERADGGRVDGAGVHQRHAGAHARQDAFRSEVGGADVGGGRQHGDDEVGFGGGLAGGLGYGCAVGLQG